MTTTTTKDRKEFRHSCDVPESLRVHKADVAEKLLFMRKQEETDFKCGDYLMRLVEDDDQQAQRQALSVDEEARARMVEWCCQVASVCDVKRQTVHVAISYFDRFLSTGCARSRTALKDLHEFQLVALSCLFIAIKLHEFEIEARHVAELSRGSYTAEDISKMEQDILTALDWRLNGPSTNDFLHQLAALLPASVLCNALIAPLILNASKQQTELAFVDYFFVLHKSSHVAYAALLNSIEGISEGIFSQHEKVEYLRSIASIAGLNAFSEEVRSVRERLVVLHGMTNGVDEATTQQLAENVAAKPVEAQEKSQEKTGVGCSLDMSNMQGELMEIEKEARSEVCQFIG